METGTSETKYDVVIIGAGPIGIACGIEASRRGIKAAIFDKGSLTDSIYRYPPQTVFFSSPRLLEIGEVPFVTAGAKSTRHEALQYYRRVVEHFELDVRTFERVEEIRGENTEEYIVRTSCNSVYEARFVVIATGYYDNPNLLGVPGEDLEKVTHYHRDPHPYYRKKVAVVGGQNSAVEAALDLFHHGAEVTLIHRRAALGDSVKYWLRPDIENRIQEGSIRGIFEAQVERIEENELVVRCPGGESIELENDFVFLMTGYHADFEFLESAGIVLDRESGKPVHDPATMETNLQGLYIAGVIAGGPESSRLFIENTRYHAKLIFQDIDRKLSLETEEKA